MKTFNWSSCLLVGACNIAISPDLNLPAERKVAKNILPLILMSPAVISKSLLPTAAYRRSHKIHSFFPPSLFLFRVGRMAHKILFILKNFEFIMRKFQPRIRLDFIVIQANVSSSSKYSNSSVSPVKIFSFESSVVVDVRRDEKAAETYKKKFQQMLRNCFMLRGN